eukprot:TRINITY_DN2883_c0_g1_i6.p1 TRINITY_DN2883_c0_g1~~TRINITY_DN2883_c0_g1_i6.p1  ORF type:complete len:332 (-),score=105.02 TRINITY_DN2883_c0_g1_i6:1769-2764(-)
MEPVSLVLKGGTNVRGAPSIDFIRLCLFPTLTKFGIPLTNFSIDIKKRGYYPEGGGEVEIGVKPVKQLNGIQLLDRGTPERIDGVVYVGGTGRSIAKDLLLKVKQNLKLKFGEHFNINIVLADEPNGADTKMSDINKASNTNSSPSPSSSSSTSSSSKQSNNKKDKLKKFQKAEDEKEHKQSLSYKDRRAMYEEQRKMTAGVAGCQLVLVTSTNCYFSGDSLIESGKSGSELSANESAQVAVDKLVEAWESGGTVDEHVMDQIIIFMALSSTPSTVLCPKKSSISSKHLETAIHFSELLCGAKFTITEVTDDNSSDLKVMKGTKIIHCLGR